MITNLQINKKLIEKILKEMERDKILQQYYYFVGDDGLKNDRKKKKIKNVDNSIQYDII